MVGTSKGKDDRVRLVSISKGAEFEIDLSRFEPGCAFAYVDDYKGGVTILEGFVADGRITIGDQPDFMWLSGPRDCMRVRPSAGSTRGLFRTQVVGEFCIQIYVVGPTGDIDLLHENDFCFK